MLYILLKEGVNFVKKKTPVRLRSYLNFWRNNYDIVTEYLTHSVLVYYAC